MIAGQIAITVSDSIQLIFVEVNHVSLYPESILKVYSLQSLSIFSNWQLNLCKK